jgi:hypothetical protein
MAMGILILILFIVFLVLVSPVLAIWAVNELLTQAGVANQIPWNFWSWLAMWLLIGCFAGTKTPYKSK